MAYQDEQNELITKQYANMRKANQAGQIEAERQNKLNLLRNANASGGFGGAEQKLQDESNTKLQQGFAANEAGIGAQESQAKLGIGEAERQRAFQTSERLGSESFAGEQARLGREQQESQFGRSLAQAGDFFNKEFGENQKTNLINAMIALKKSGFFDKNMDELANFFSSGLGENYGNIVNRGQIPAPRPLSSWESSGLG